MADLESSRGAEAAQVPMARGAARPAALSTAFGGATTTFASASLVPRLAGVQERAWFRVEASGGLKPSRVSKLGSAVNRTGWNRHGPTVSEVLP